jgi:hypothetical protein
VPDTGARLDAAPSLSFYSAFFREEIPKNWMNRIALPDATQAGAVPAVSLSTGLSLAIRLAEWLRDLRERARA